MADREDSAPQQETRDNAQAHLVRAAKVPDWGDAPAGALPQRYRTQDWTMFYFFRILQAPSTNTPPDQGTAQGAGHFRKWLKVLAEYEPKSGRAAALQVLSLFGGSQEAAPLAELTINTADDAAAIAESVVLALGSDASPEAAQKYAQFFTALHEQRPEVFAGLLAGFNPANHTDKPWPLFRMVLFELVRQSAPSLTGPSFVDGSLPAVRAEATELDRQSKGEPFDRTPTNICFSYSGLEALDLHPETLASFPEAFRQGMAARSEQLRDVGPSGPEHWEGELGLRSIHGYIASSAGLERVTHHNPSGRVKEEFWSRLRAEIRIFNDPVDDEGRRLRKRINDLLKPVGFEVLHIELGQDPYTIENEHVVRIPARKEHFGFRDGLSQPYVDLGLQAPQAGQAGGGSPSRRSTWTPVARGEIFLDSNDENGKPHHYPSNATLRLGSTYLVFRKLEQDVVGFRNYLASQRADKHTRDALAAQIVGRWPDGTSLVQSPTAPRAIGNEASLNDFRYGVDDPLGQKCPLGAHVRRANPRDTGDRDNVRHHRIVRRGISYGGRLLGENDPDDGEKRGVLFVAANASIDTQFEVIQGNWINGGEFQGQAGLGRCPLIGTREGREGSSFLEAGSGTPLRGLPQFVTMRGGDYFFAPGLAALNAIARRDRFVPDAANPFAGLSTARAAPISPFAPPQLMAIAGKILQDPALGVVSVVPRANAAMPPIVFIAKHADVSKVLCDEIYDKRTTRFSVAQIRASGMRIARGDEWPIGTDVRGPGASARTRLLAVLNQGWERLYKDAGGEAALQARLARIVSGKLEAALLRVRGTRTIDLIDDFAAPAAYGVVAELYGLPGPAWLTEMAMALPFSRQHAGALPREWMAAMRGETPSNPQLITLQVWTCVMTADLIANAQQLRELQVLSRQAGSEMLNHLDLEIEKARGRVARQGPSPATTLVEAFVANQEDPAMKALYDKAGKDWQVLYYRNVAILLLEIISSTLAIIPFTFGQVMQLFIDQRLDLGALLPGLTPDDLDMAVYEAERLNPNIAFRLRQCEVKTTIGGQTIHPGDTVMALTGAAGRDPRAFPEPKRFSLGKQGCPMRDRSNYLVFGVPAVKGSNKDCWGRDRVALPVLRECVRVAGRLQGLRRVAGPRGEPQKLAGVTVGLPARFTALGPDLVLGTDSLRSGSTCPHATAPA